MSDTYYVPFNRGIPKLGVEPRKMISYYQWVPLLLLGQACLFFVPCIVWRFLNKRSVTKCPVTYVQFSEITQQLPRTQFCQLSLWFCLESVSSVGYRSGLSLPAVMEAGVACQRAIYVETREKTVRYMVSQIDGYLMVQRSYKVSSCALLPQRDVVL